MQRSINHTNFLLTSKYIGNYNLKIDVSNNRPYDVHKEGDLGLIHNDKKGSFTLQLLNELYCEDTARPHATTN